MSSSTTQAAQTKKQLKKSEEDTLVKILGLTDPDDHENHDTKDAEEELVGKSADIRERSVDQQPQGEQQHIHLPKHDHRKWREMRESGVVTLKVTAKASQEENNKKKKKTEISQREGKQLGTEEEVAKKDPTEAETVEAEAS